MTEPRHSRQTLARTRQHKVRPHGDSDNTSGQRFCDDWRGNPTWDSDDMSDKDGFELQELRREM